MSPMLARANVWARPSNTTVAREARSLIALGYRSSQEPAWDDHLLVTDQLMCGVLVGDGLVLSPRGLEQHNPPRRLLRDVLDICDWVTG
jgi:hypothetical protein